MSIDGARGVLINITGGPDMTLWEVNEASTLVQEAAHEEANIIFGAVIDENAREGEVRVTVIATGLDDERVRVGDRGAPRETLAPLGSLDRDPLTQSSEAPPATVAREARVAPNGDAGSAESIAVAGTEDFVSPFEDELDVPAFLRRRRGEGEEDDTELPAFLRRQAD